MNSIRCLMVIAVTSVRLVAAEQAGSTDETKPAVVLPVMKVSATKFERFGMMTATGPNGTRLLVWHVPTKSDMFKMLVGGAEVGDEIVAIDGKEVATIPRHQWQSRLRGYFKIIVKRRVGRRSFQLLELDGRGD